MGANEKVEATFHPVRSPWTDEDVAAAAQALHQQRLRSLDLVGVGIPGETYRRHMAPAREVLAALAPRVDALVRAGQVEALRTAADLIAEVRDGVRLASYINEHAETARLTLDASVETLKDMADAVERGQS